ncbi:hypothetical protein PoB_002416600 [Plakobranchus ocellatus]|uniref:Uncharacterized protein n=1 Tax=Plakobranchus ocellatus TaxID=259542 RepID=A0AAV3ZT22_9GAST|nr:hypothetical protein PoB_002416600 [Plakobranchus ocellatus]
MCTQDVQLSTRGRQVGKTSECAHKRSKAQHVIGNLARLPNVHTRGPTLTRDRKLGKTSECAVRCPTLNTGLEFGKISERAHKSSNS